MRKKVIVALTGGLGNQMFQYAFGKVLKKRYNVEVEFDSSFYDIHPEWSVELDKYNVKDFVCKSHPFYAKIRLLTQRIPFVRWVVGTYKERSVYEIDQNIYRHKYKFYSGYWQNYRYFEEFRRELVDEFRYMGDLPDETIKASERMDKEKPIAVHVRRGDYLNKEYKNVYYVLGEDYYRKAIEQARRETSDDKPIFFFSNDIEWCKNTYGDIEGALFVDKKISNSEHTDLYLMMHADYLIMANSTFSWWAGWLSSHSNHITFPTQWYYNSEKNRKAVQALKIII